MQLIGEEGIDLAILPIGDNFTMGPDDALRAVKLIQPKRVIRENRMLQQKLLHRTLRLL